MTDIGTLSKQITPVAIVNADGTLLAETGSSGTTVVSPNVDTDSQITGQINIPTPGTAVQGPDVALTNGVFVKAHPANTGNVAVGNDGSDDVTMTNGFVLDAGEIILIQVANLNELWFDAATGGDDL